MPEGAIRYWLIMPAAGAGLRFGAAVPKQYALLHGRTVIEWALAPFLADPRCLGAVVALAAGDERFGALAPRLPRPVRTVIGGAQRGESVLAALQALSDQAAPADWVLVHDAARPCLAAADLDRLLEHAGAHETGGLLAVPGADTLKLAGAGASRGTPATVAAADAADEGAAADAVVERTVERTGLWRALTPQMFRFGALLAALEGAIRSGRQPTDESQAMEWTGARTLLVAGAAGNIKVTTPQDLAVAAALLAVSRPAAGGGTREAGMRIGQGVDVHAFGAGDAVMLGGVRIPYSRGVVAHSDGDVVLHALCDALLGGAGLGDIGQHFRDDDPRWRGADSRRFVRAVVGMLRERGLAAVNADVTVLAEAPRLGRHRDEIRRSIAELLEVDAACVNVKATTTEKLGFLGRGEGLAAQAVVLLGPVADSAASTAPGAAPGGE